MRDAEQEGSIINISSIAGLDHGQSPGGVAYDSSKAGLNTFYEIYWEKYFIDLSKLR